MNKIKPWLYPLGYMILIFILSSFPAPEPARKIPIIMQIKLVHILEYGLLCLLFIYAFYKTTYFSLTLIILLSIITTVLYGISDEIHQIFVPTRDAKLIDAVTNFLGAVLAGWGYNSFRQKINNLFNKLD